MQASLSTESPHYLSPPSPVLRNAGFTVPKPENGEKEEKADAVWQRSGPPQLSHSEKSTSSDGGNSSEAVGADLGKKKLTVEKRRLKAVCVADYLSNSWKRSSIYTSIAPALNERDYPRTFRGNMPLTINTGFSFGDLNGYLPIYLHQILCVYLLEGAAKSWNDTNDYSLTSSEVKKTPGFVEIKSTWTLSGQQNISKVNSVIATPVKVWGVKSYPKIAKGKKFTKAAAEQKLAFIKLKAGTIKKVFIHHVQYAKMEGAEAQRITFEFNRMLKDLILLMPCDYKFKILPTENYQNLISRFIENCGE